MKSTFFELTMNNIMRMLVGDHVSETEEGRKYIDRVERSFRAGGSALVLEDYLPILRWFSGLESKLHEVNDGFVQDIIDEHRRMLNDEAAFGEVKKATIDVLLSLQNNGPEYYSDEMIKGFLLVSSGFLLFHCYFFKNLTIALDIHKPSKIDSNNSTETAY